jgi:hypothetical protein
VPAGQKVQKDSVSLANDEFYHHKNKYLHALVILPVPVWNGGRRSTHPSGNRLCVYLHA